MSSFVFTLFCLQCNGNTHFESVLALTPMEKYFSESSKILVNKIHFIQIQSCSMETSVDGKFENVNNL